MLYPLINEILGMKADSRELTVRGWVRTKRDMKNLVFVEVNDGSCFSGIQCTFDRGAAPALSPPGEPGDLLSGLSTGAAVEITGKLVPSPAAGQAVELAAERLSIAGDAPAENIPPEENRPGTPPYPLQKKRHSLDFLREMAHLRPRTNTFAAVARVRNRMAFAIHEYFQARGFRYVHTPIITASDAEGAGAMFQVTALQLEKLAQSGAPVDYGRDFFGRKTGLTVSGQLEAESYATALSRVYTFGPTFRAENSNTSRHLAEFWMIEPELAFADLEDDMDLAEDFLKFLFSTALRDCREDLAFFDAHIERGIIDTLGAVVNSTFTRMTYTDAVKELEKAGLEGKGGPRGLQGGPAGGPAGFEFKPYWGCDLQSEHEKYLTEKVAGGPVILTDYPGEIKAFYMKQNDDGKTVRAMDVLVPRLGEIIGGSQREENLERLYHRMKELGMSAADYSWYLDLRRYGTVPHAGFGMGFERMLQYVTGMANIRDVIPFPRAAGQAAF